jgi:mutator protein MutT
MPGYWEFPGGKCEGDESPEHAARRECLEESGLEVDRCVLRRMIHHSYPHGAVELNYFDCTPLHPLAEPGESTGFVWKSVEELPHLQFPEANEAIIGGLVQEASLSMRSLQSE